MEEIRICSKCQAEKPLSKMKRSTYKDTYRYRSYCTTCYNKDNAKCGDPVVRAAKAQRASETAQLKKKQRIVAFDPLTIARRIKDDSRKADRRKSHNNDLDVEFIIKHITQNCSYCDRSFKSCRMTLDRVNNDLGHLKSNVVPSCHTCNMVRGNMPYDAWLHVAPGMKSARLAGLLDNWDGPRLNRKTKLP